MTKYVPRAKHCAERKELELKFDFSVLGLFIFTSWRQEVLRSVD